MRYRLPPELELRILELAAPPLAIDRLHDRVEFFINASLVHRSLTQWAQERLHDQFLYTYQARPDEHERLKTRLEAGFGRDRPLRRLYLDLTRLPEDPRELEEPGTVSVSYAIHRRYFGAMSLVEGPAGPDDDGTTAHARAREAVAVAHIVESETRGTLESYWALCPVMEAYSQVIDTLWLKPPVTKLDIADWPRKCATGPVFGRLLSSLRLIYDCYRSTSRALHQRRRFWRTLGLLRVTSRLEQDGGVPTQRWYRHERRPERSRSAPVGR